MTKKTKEAIKTSAVIAIVILAVFFLWIFPLNQAGKIVGRPETDEAIPDIETMGLAADDMAPITEDNIKLAGMFFPADSTVPDAPLGTFILVHGLNSTSQSQIPKVAALTAIGYDVVIYDQRAYGHSEGEYRSGGYFEANDLQSVISRLDLTGRLIHPVVVWGEGHGATAAVREWPEEDRIDYVIAEDIVVDGRDWQKRVIENDELWSMDILLPTIWWWMKQTSGYEINFEDFDISGQFAEEITDHGNNLLAIGYGATDTPSDKKVAELKNMGGHWLVVSFPEGSTAFEANKDTIMSAVTGMLAPAPADSTR